MKGEIGDLARKNEKHARCMGQLSSGLYDTLSMLDPSQIIGQEIGTPLFLHMKS